MAEIIFHSDVRKAHEYIDSMSDDMTMKMGHLASMPIVLPKSTLDKLLPTTREGWKTDVTKSTLIVAERDGATVGILSAARVNAAGKTVYSISIVSTMKGVGSTLMKEYKRRYPKAITSAVVEPDNLPAMALAMKHCDYVGTAMTKAILQHFPNKAHLAALGMLKDPDIGFDLRQFMSIEQMSITDKMIVEMMTAKVSATDLESMTNFAQSMMMRAA